MLEYEVYDAADALFEEQHPITAEEWADAQAQGFNVGELEFDGTEFGYNAAVNRALTEAEHEEMLELQDWKMERGGTLPDDEAYRLNHLEGISLRANCGCEACYELRKQMEFDRTVEMFGFAA
jgi:hypothetical protein